MTDAMPKEIAEAIITMMVKVGYIQKTGTNSFHNYKYAKIETLLEKVQPALTECGLVISQDELAHAVIADGNLMEATYAFSLSHRSGAQWGPIRHTGLASLRNSKGGYDDKALNKCHTAARKYFILALLQIPTGDHVDPDEEEDKPEMQPRQHAPRHAEPRNVAPKGKEGKTTATEYVDNQMAILPGLNAAGLKTWEINNAETRKRLKAADEKEAARLTAAFDGRKAELSNYGIAAE